MQWPQAVSAYREAMLSWQEHEDHLECDKLQVGGAMGGASKWGKGIGWSYHSR